MIDKEVADYLAVKKTVIFRLSHHAIIGRALPIFLEDLRRAIAKKGRRANLKSAGWLLEADQQVYSAQRRDLIQGALWE